MTNDFFSETFKFIVLACDNMHCHLPTGCHQINKEVTTNGTFAMDIVKNIVTIILALIAGSFAIYQMKVNIISSARIRWIEELRETLSKFYPVILDTILAWENRKLFIKTNDPKHNEYYAAYSLNITRYNSLSNKIKMLLNSNEPDHKAIENIIDKIDEQFDQDNINNASQKDIEMELKIIVNHSKSIFKKEWEKSKRVFKV